MADQNTIAKSKMTLLHSQEVFEDILKEKKPHPAIVIYFTANWCGPCKRINLPKIMTSNPDIQWYLCDMDDNDYTAGYCGVKSIPSFLAIKNGKPITPAIQNSNADAVVDWLKTVF